MNEDADRPLYWPLAQANQQVGHEDSAPADTAALVRLAGKFGTEAIARYRAENPEAFLALSKNFAAGAAHFDLSIRDVTGHAPCIELVAVLTDREVVIASQVLKRRLASEAN